MPVHHGYSSKVALTLLVGGMNLALSHVGPRGFIIRDECEPIAEGDAELIIKVNQSINKYKIFLPHGIPGPRQLVEFI